MRQVHLLVVLAPVALATGCAREVGSDTPAESAAPSRATVAIAASETAGPLSFQTTLYSERDADLYNRLMVDENVGVGIPVTAIHVEVGNRVRTGQVLANLDDADARLQVSAAEPEAETATSNLRRVEALSQSGAVSEAEYEDALYRSRTADVTLEKARLNLSRTQVRAPFAGVVSRRYVRIGDVVTDQMPLFRVTALSPLRARLLVPESDVAAFGRGTPVQVRGADDATATAQVILVGPTVDPGTGTREVIVELSDVGNFRPGASVTVEPVDPPEAEAGQESDAE